MPDMSATRRACASTSPTRSAFCSPVEALAAGASFGPWRTARSPTCGPIRVRPAAASRSAIAEKHRAIAVLRFERRAVRSERLDLAFERKPRPGKGRGVVAPGGDQRLEPVHALEPRGGDGDAELGRLPLDRVEPAGVATILLEELVAPAERPLELADPRAVSWDRSRERTGRESGAARSPARKRANPSPASARRLAHGRRRRATTRRARDRCGFAAPRRPRRLPATSPSRADAARRSRRLRLRAQSRRRPLVGRIRRAPPGASPAPARAATAPRGDWSCRRRSRRIGRRGGPRSRDRAPHRIGNPAASAAAREGSVARDERRRGLPWRWRLPCPAAARKWELQAEWKRG